MGTIDEGFKKTVETLKQAKAEADKRKVKVKHVLATKPLPKPK